MIKGTVNSAREAVVTLAVSGAAERSRAVAAVVDTGYSGDITLPSEVVNDLALVHVGSTKAKLANGGEAEFATYVASVDWSGYKRGVVVHAAESVPLIGMHLLEGHRLRVDVEHGGRVLVEPLAS